MHVRVEQKSENERDVSECKQAEEQSKDSGPGDESYGLPRVLQLLQTLFCKTGFTR